MLALLCGAATLAMDALRVTGWLTVSDVFLAVAGLCLLPELRSATPTRIRQATPMLAGLVLLLAGGALGSLLFDPTSTDSFTLLKLGVAMGGTLLLVLLWGPSASEIRWFCWLWVLSASVSGLVPRYDGVERAGLAYHPNGLALTAVLATGPALALFASSRGKARWLALACLCALAVSVFLSGSRSGLLAFAAVLAVTAACLGSREIKAAVAVALTLIGIGVVVAASGIAGESTAGEPAGGNVLGRLLPGDHWAAGSNSARKDSLRRELSRARDHPVTGSGFGPELERAHSAPLEIWASAGLLGLLGFALFAGAAVRPLFALKLDKGAKTSAPVILTLGLASGFSGWLVASLFQHALWSRWLWMTPAMIAALYMHSRTSPGPRADARREVGWQARTDRRRHRRAAITTKSAPSRRSGLGDADGMRPEDRVGEPWG